ncbi:MAG TPA: hypothetical protein VGD01_07780 [Candidatus Elarobacter sp.]|jgi:hypothetical protein
MTLQHTTCAYRVLRTVAVTAFAVSLSGCVSTAHRTATGAATPAAGARATAPAPANPDLAAVMERFYQQVEGGHWTVADGMLSPRFRAASGPNGVRALYAPLADLDVSLRQTTDRTVVASLTALDRADRARKRRFEETVTLRWDGEDWTVDAIARRALTGGTR